MPRQPRYFIADIPQHVIQRGVDRQAVFFAPEDYELYLHSLRAAALKYSCRIHAYVLMTNHTHLLLTPENDRSLPLLMQEMGRTYVQTLNKQYGRTGTLWQGRYKASLVQDDHYFLACHKYIEQNPVRAGMVRSPGDYPYSSFGCNANGKPDKLIAIHRVYKALGDTPERRLVAYRKLFDSVLATALISKIRKTTNACRVLGDDKFHDQIEKMLGRSVRPPRRGRPPKSNG